MHVFLPNTVGECDDSTVSVKHTQALGRLPQPPSTVAVLPHNKAHNRFNNIYPCELLCLITILSDIYCYYIYTAVDTLCNIMQMTSLVCVSRRPLEWTAVTISMPLSLMWDYDIDRTSQNIVDIWFYYRGMEGGKMPISQHKVIHTTEHT